MILREGDGRGRERRGRKRGTAAKQDKGERGGRERDKKDQDGPRVIRIERVRE